MYRVLKSNHGCTSHYTFKDGVNTGHTKKGIFKDNAIVIGLIVLQIHERQIPQLLHLILNLVTVAVMYSRHRLMQLCQNLTSK